MIMKQVVLEEKLENDKWIKISDLPDANDMVREIALKGNTYKYYLIHNSEGSSLYRSRTSRLLPLILNITEAFYESRKTKRPTTYENVASGINN